MGPEQVVDFLNQDTGERYKLDINNGDIYDLAGNKVGQAQYKDSSDTHMLADVLQYDMDRIALASVDSAVSDPKGIMREKARAAAVRMGAREAAAVRMDLGVGDVSNANQTIPNYAAGYRNEQPMADVYSPALLQGRPAGLFYAFKREDAFQRALPVAGAPGGSVAEVSPRIAKDPFATVQRAIGAFTSTEVEAAADAPLRIRQAALKRVINAMVLEREIRVAALAAAAASWDTSVLKDLTSDATLKWNGGSASDPIKDLHDMLDASSGDVSGIIMKGPLYRAFVRNDKVKAYYGFKDGTGAIPKPSEASHILDLPPIYEAKMRVLQTDGSLRYIWGNDVTLFRQPDEVPPMSQEDIASSYTFRWNIPQNLVQSGVAGGGYIVREFFVEGRGPLGGNMVVVVSFDAEIQTSKYVGGRIKGAWQ